MNLKRSLSCAILLPVDVIAFGRVRRVVIGGYVAGKTLIGILVINRVDLGRYIIDLLL